MGIVLREVSTKRELKSFIRFPDNLYRDCKYYIPALHRSQFRVLSNEYNPAFDHCEARYWLALSNGRVVGRVAGIINNRYNIERAGAYMRFGWLDFAEDPEIPERLLGEVEDWAKKKGMEYIHGPLGFTSFDASGVLVEGFEEWPTSFGRYNFPYYNDMLCACGYSKDIDWIEYNISVPEEKPERVLSVAQIVKKRYSLKNARLDKRNDVRRYSAGIFSLLNTVYNGLYGFSTLTEKQVEDLAQEFISLIHPDYVSVVLNENEEVVAFGVVMPSLTKALKKAGGKLYPFGMIHILKALRSNDTIDMLLIGAKPEYQNKGATSLVFEKIIGTIYDKGIRHVETTRELESNNKVLQLWSGYDYRLHKRARCYIKPVWSV